MDAQRHRVLSWQSMSITPPDSSTSRLLAPARPLRSWLIRTRQMFAIPVCVRCLRCCGPVAARRRCQLRETAKVAYLCLAPVEPAASKHLRPSTTSPPITLRKRLAESAVGGIATEAAGRPGRAAAAPCEQNLARLPAGQPRVLVDRLPRLVGDLEPHGAARFPPPDGARSIPRLSALPVRCVNAVGVTGRVCQQTATAR